MHDEWVCVWHTWGSSSSYVTWLAVLASHLDTILQQLLLCGLVCRYVRCALLHNPGLVLDVSQRPWDPQGAKPFSQPL